MCLVYVWFNTHMYVISVYILCLSLICVCMCVCDFSMQYACLVWYAHVYDWHVCAIFKSVCMVAMCGAHVWYRLLYTLCGWCECTMFNSVCMRLLSVVYICGVVYTCMISVTCI